MPRPVRVVSGWTIGGGGRLRELFRFRPWMILLGRAVLWIVRHYIITAHAVLWLWLAIRTDALSASVWVALLVGVTAWGYVVFTGRRAGVPVRSTVSGLARRWQLERRWNTCARAAKLVTTGDGGAVAPLKKVTLTVTGGLLATVDVGRVGKTADELRSSAVGIASTMHATRYVVRGVTGDLGLATVELSWVDPLTRELRLADLPPPTKKRLPFGLTTEGLPVSIALDSALLITGVTRSGKSTLTWGLLAMVRVLFAPDEVRLWVIDPKGGMELRALRPYAYRYAKEISEIVAVMREAATEMKARQDVLGDEGLRKFVPSARTPWNIIIIDEALALTIFMPPREAAAVERALGLLITQGAAAGFTPWLGTQGAQIDALGRIRTFIPQRICLKVDSPESVEAALGSNTRHEAPANKIPSTLRGVGYFALEGTEGYARFRSAWVPDHETAIIAAGGIPQSLRLAQEKVTSLDARTTYVYHLYDAEGRPLRYGISDDPGSRFKQYEATTDWWQDVRYREVDPYPNRKMALAVEKADIGRDQPIHNDQHNPSFRGRVRRAMRREHTNA